MRISVIIRARDQAANIDRALTLLRAQDVRSHAVETVVIDNGSHDGTGTIARTHGARVVDLPREAFSFGGALNLGAANARGELLVALSADAFPPDQQWLGRLVGPFENARVACASGDRFGPDGEQLTEPVRQDIELARRRPEWGYSNAAGAFRRELWQRRPFRDDLPGSEDKEWALHWLAQGFLCVIDPWLAPEHDHTHDSLASIYRRARREAAGYAMFLEPDEYGARDLARDWWADVRWYDSPLRARLSHRRAARMLGAYAGRRSVSGRGGWSRDRASATGS
jgi:rhamnosyltransferase